jgi:hypothetical protein
MVALSAASALASPPATKALDHDPFTRRSLRHAVYAALLHFDLKRRQYCLPISAFLINEAPLQRSFRQIDDYGETRQ